ncbi:MAG: hypothetical protein ACFFA7_13240 [Promethearchaeota archaeon]
MFKIETEKWVECLMISKEKLMRWKIEAAHIFNECRPVDFDTIRLWKLISDILIELDGSVLKPKLDEKVK